MTPRRRARRRAVRETLYTYRRRATANGQTFGLTPRDFERLLFRTCHYCGAPPSNTWQRPKLPAVKYNGLDRQDNARGYELDNCVTCCRTCNELKRAVPLPIWRRWLRAITRHQVRLALEGDTAS